MSAITMKPIQVYLRPEQIDSLRAIAERRKISMAELIRQGVDHMLSEVPAEEDPLWSIIGTFDSGLGDLAEKHDEYLARLIHEENHG
jgi:Ribbon-helix-helix domain